MMIGHILPPLRTPVDERNLETLVDVYGCYGDQTERALKAIIDGTSNAAEIKSLGRSAPAWGYEIKETAVSHSRQKDGNVAKGTFDKLQKLYPAAVTATDVGKIIDKELLVGLVPNDQKPEEQKDKHPIKDTDVGIYELYQEDDWDGDGVSNYVEVESSNSENMQMPVQYFKKIIGNTSYDDQGYEGNYFETKNKDYVSRQETIKAVTFDPLKTLEEQKAEDSTNFAVMQSRLKAIPRGRHGKHGEMVVEGAIIDTGDYAPDTAVSHGMRIPDFGKGYYYDHGADTEDTDNYGILTGLVQKLEEVGRKWSEEPSISVPPDLKRAVGAPGYGRSGYLGLRFGINDLSLPGGRYFRKKLPPGQHDHASHRTGLDVDVRYVRKPECGEGRLFVNVPTAGWYKKRQTTVTDLETSSCYDLAATKALMAQFAAGMANEIYVDDKADILPTGVNRKLMTFKVDGADYTVLVAKEKMHDNHFHVRFPGNYGPVGDVEFTPSSLSLRAGDNTEVTITTSVIRDVNGFAIFEGYPIYISVLDSEGKPRGLLKEKRKNNSYWTDEQGRLTIKYQASITPGKANLQLWADAGRKTLPIGKPLPITFTAK